MTKRTADLQIEQIRRRLSALKEVVVDEPLVIRKNHTIVLFFALTVLGLCFLSPTKTNTYNIGPFVSVFMQDFEMKTMDNDYLAGLSFTADLKDPVPSTGYSMALKPPSTPNLPDVRYASSKIVLVKPPEKPVLVTDLDKRPLLDKAEFTHEFAGSLPTESQVTSDKFAGQIDDLKGAIVAVVVKSDQEIHIFQNGSKKYSWKVSTARSGKITPAGTWKAQWLSKHHKSSIYDNAPMPFSIFYNGNFAIHGTNQINLLGSPASSGCVRLHPKNAEILFAMVEQAGPSNLTVRVIE